VGGGSPTRETAYLEGDEYDVDGRAFGPLGSESPDCRWVSLVPLFLLAEGDAGMTLALAGLVVLALVLWVGWRRRRARGLADSRIASRPQSAWVTQPVVFPPGSGLAETREAGDESATMAGSPGASTGGARVLLGLDDPDPGQPVPSGRPPRGAIVVAVLAGALIATGGWLLAARNGESSGGEVVWWQGSRPNQVDLAATPSTGRSEENATVGVEPEATRMTVVDPERGIRLIAWSGSGQVGEPGRPLRRALAVVVRDSADRPIPGAEVRFAVAAGGGRLEPSSVTTSDLGLAATTWWLGTNPDSLRVTAYLATPPGLRVEFGAMIQEGTEGRAGVVAAASPEPEPEAEPASTPEQREAEPARSPEPAVAAPLERAAASAPEAVAIRPHAAFSAGGVQTCRVLAGGAVCWGSDEGASRVAGSQPGAPALRAVSVGVFHACGLTQRGTVHCWPVQSGRASLAASGAELELPDRARSVAVVAGSEHSCALTADGAVFCWGANAHGQLGNGTVADTGSPVRVQGLPPVTQLAAGWAHTCALTAAGRAYCWGANGRGQVGDGTTTDRVRATTVDHEGGFVLLTGGSAHSCGLTRAGVAWCWGSNEHGQLGTGGGNPQPRPGRVAGGHTFRTVAAGGVHTCALTGAGRAWCWGRNTFGQLGDGTTRNGPVPVAVAGDVRLVALAAGGAHTCGETDVGRLYCWGNNVQGQVGDGTRENRHTPVRTLQEGQR
jgi:alpha-tubulin suppressor-like RCC1 family protein